MITFPELAQEEGGPTFPRKRLSGSPAWFLLECVNWLSFKASVAMYADPMKLAQGAECWAECIQALAGVPF